MLGKLCQSFAMALRQGDDLHLLQVVRKLSAAIQANDVSTSQICSRGTMCGTAIRYRKAIAVMPATKNCLYQSCDHIPTFHTRTGLSRVP